MPYKFSVHSQMTCINSEFSIQTQCLHHSAFYTLGSFSLDSPIIFSSFKLNCTIYFLFGVHLLLEQNEKHLELSKVGMTCLKEMQTR